MARVQTEMTLVSGTMRLPFLLLLVGTFALGTDLKADEVEPPAWVEAAKLLDEGRELMSKPPTLERGCIVLEQSYALRQRGDTLLNLAECHRRQGKTATAWREFDEAIRYAKEAAFSEAIRAAQAHRDELSKTLSELVIEAPVGADRPVGLTVTLDGTPLPEQQWGQTLYVDPGLHMVVATAPNHHSFSGSAEVEITGNRSVIVLKLLKLPEPPKPKPPPPKPPPPPPRVEPELPIWALVVGGAGLAMMGASTAFLTDSIATGDELDIMCGGEERLACRPGYPYADKYDRELVGFGMFVGLGASGLIAAGFGITGLALAYTSDSPAVAVLPWADPHSAGGSIVGSF